MTDVVARVPVALLVDGIGRRRVLVAGRGWRRPVWWAALERCARVKE